MLIIPGATAYLLTDRFSRMLVIAPVISALWSIAGIYLSYYLDTASGAMVVLTQAAAFAVVYLFSPPAGPDRDPAGEGPPQKSGCARCLSTRPTAARAAVPEERQTVSYLTTQAAAGPAGHLLVRTP